MCKAGVWKAGAAALHVEHVSALHWMLTWGCAFVLIFAAAATAYACESERRPDGSESSECDSPWLVKTWGHYKDAEGDGWNEYCERTFEDAFLRQRIAAVSSIAYAIAGLVPLSLSVADCRTTVCSLEDVRRPAEVLPPNLLLAPGGHFLSTFCGLCYLWLGAASFLFHATRSSRMQILDMLGVYFSLSVHMGYGLHRVQRCLCRVPVVTGRCSAMVCLSLMIIFCALTASVATGPNPPPGSAIMGLQLLVVVSTYSISYGSCCRRCGDPKSRSVMSWCGWALFGASLLCLVIGGIFWRIDWGWDAAQNGCNFEPDGWVQGHAAWHVLTAVAFLLVYLFIRSETIVDPVQKLPICKSTEDAPAQEDVPKETVAATDCSVYGASQLQDAEACLEESSRPRGL
eukprot:TRINITY_DN43016_c0_g1_i1.p1 TRINITY_DN43016_c0_g1~~TRINITY_DN43016_c0_g1_i1.p1  ORF type:complete len:401 (+),score=25.50 TRINITY_DN43016_c0_g1_i1:120-1322(+)